MTATRSTPEALWIEEILQRIAADLSMITDRELGLGPSRTVRAAERPAGAGAVHIAFRFGIHVADSIGHGCLLMPLPEAVSLAGYLMMLSDAEVLQRRELEAPDESLKEALLEVDNFIAGAADAALRATLGKEIKVRPEGCQGVRADVRPALIYQEGQPLLVGRAQACLQGHSEFELMLLLPELGVGSA
jgi:hypothetical protein